MIIKKYDGYAEKWIENCSECSRNRLNYPQKEEVCLHYKDKDTETSVDGFPSHCPLEEKREMSRETVLIHFIMSEFWCFCEEKEVATEELKNLINDFLEEVDEDD